MTTAPASPLPAGSEHARAPTDDPAPLPPSPFTREQAAAAGVTDWALRGSRCVRVLTNVYVDAALALTPALRARAALLAAPPGSVVARHDAARLWGGVVPDSPDLHLLVPAGSRVRADGISARSAADVVVAHRDGIPVTSVVQTFLDLAGDLGLVDLVVLGDSFVRRNVVTCAELAEAARTGRGRGVRLARRAAGLVRAGVDSPMESRLRMLIVLAGLPEPEVNHILREDDGAWRLRFDLAYPELKIAIEYDGRQHAGSTTQWVRDVGRREELDTLGWRLVVVLSGDVYTHPSRTIERILAVLADRGRPVTVSGRAWTRHFPDRVPA